MLGSGDAIWFTNPNGNPARPPENQLVAAGSRNAGIVAEVENPNRMQVPTIGTPKMATEEAPSDPRLTAAEPIPTAPTLRSLVLDRCRVI